MKLEKEFMVAVLLDNTAGVKRIEKVEIGEVTEEIYPGENFIMIFYHDKKIIIKKESHKSSIEEIEGQSVLIPNGIIFVSKDNLHQAILVDYIFGSMVDIDIDTIYTLSKTRQIEENSKEFETVMKIIDGISLYINIQDYIK